MQRGAVLMQSRAGLLEPVRVDPRKQPRTQRDVGTAVARTPQPSRAADSRQMAPGRRLAEHQPVGDPGHQAGDRPQLRRTQLQDKRQMQKELQEVQRSELGGAGGAVRARGGPLRPVIGPGGRHPIETGRLSQGQLPPGPLALNLTSPPHIHGGYFLPGSLKHFSSKSGGPPDKVWQGTATRQLPQRAVGAMAHLVAPMRVGSTPAGISPRDLPLASPRTPIHSPSFTPRGFAEDNTSPRFSSDTEKTPRSVVGRQEGGSKASPRLSAEAAIANSPRRAQGDAAAASERRRGVPKDQGDQRLLQNLNLKVAETKGGRVSDKGKFQTITGVPGSGLNKTMNDVASGQMRSNPYSAGERGGAAVYQMQRKVQFGRGGTVGPPHRDTQGVGLESYSAKPAQFQGRSVPGMPQLQMPTMPSSARIPMSSPKINPTRALTDSSRMASQKKSPTPAAKKTTDSPPKSPVTFSPPLLLASPVTSPINSPRPSLMTTRNAPPKNTTTGRITNTAKAATRNSPKSPSPRNSPARTYVITPKHSPTALPVPSRRTPTRSAQATATGNVSTKLQVVSSGPRTTTSTTTAKDRKGKFQNPKSRLSAGGDLQIAKEKPKSGPYKVVTGKAASTYVDPLAEELATAPPAQNQPSREADESPHEAKEPSDLNKEEQLTKRSPRVRKMTRTSLQPVQNPSTPRSAVSELLQDEEQGTSENTVAKQPEATPRKNNAGDGNKKQLPSVKNRKGASPRAIHTEGAKEAPRGRPAAARHKRSQRSGRDSPRSLDVAAALPDTSGNFTSAVHQWLRQSHYKVISPQQYRQHETIEEETLKQPGLAEKIMAFRDERLPKAAAPELEKAPAPAPPEKGARRGRVAAPRCGAVARSLSPLSARYQPRAQSPRPLRAAPLSLLLNQKDIVVVPKQAAAPAGRVGKKASKAAAASTDTGRRKAAPKRGTTKARGVRRKKEKDKEKEPRSGAKLAPSACPRLRPKLGPAGDSGDLSSSSEDSSYLSASDEAMNEQSAMC